MNARGALLREIDALEIVQQALAEIAERTDDDRRHELIDLRRRLSTQIARVGEVAEPVVAELTPEAARAFRAKFSAMRSGTALHQASWPAVRLGEDPQAYAASALLAREANRAFIAWVRVTLAS